MNQPEVKPRNRVVTLQSVNGCCFRCTQYELLNVLGPPEAVRENYNGEVEFHFGDTIYRCFHHYFVECTFPDRGVTNVNGVDVLSVYNWLGGLDDCVDRAMFRISPAIGMAYDRRDPEHGSITVFAEGHWDTLIAANHAGR